MATTFTLNEKEEKRKLKIFKKLKKKYGKVGHITYSFTPTGIGSIVKFHSDVNDKTYDITDIDSW
jgi:hypothetical protein